METRHHIVFVVVGFLLLFMGGVVPDSFAASQNQVIQPQTSIEGDQIIPPEAGISWKERVMMWREIKKRGAASRNALMGAAAEKPKKKDAPKPTAVKSPLDL